MSLWSNASISLRSSWRIRLCGCCISVWRKDCPSLKLKFELQRATTLKPLSQCSSLSSSARDATFCNEPLIIPFTAASNKLSGSLRRGTSMGSVSILSRTMFFCAHARSFLQNQAALVVYVKTLCNTLCLFAVSVCLTQVPLYFCVVSRYRLLFVQVR